MLTWAPMDPTTAAFTILAEVDDLAEASEQLENVEQRLSEGRTRDRHRMAPRGPRNFEMKWAGPDGVVLDVSHTGWDIG